MFTDKANYLITNICYMDMSTVMVRTVESPLLTLLHILFVFDVR